MLIGTEQLIMRTKIYSIGHLRFVCAVLCTGFLLWSGASTHGQEADHKSQPNSGKPLHITSDKMEVDNPKNFIVFIGNVKANQGDMRIQAKRLEVYTKQAKRKTGAEPRASAADRAGEIDRIVAIGNVLMEQEKRRFATADRLEYHESTGVAVLTGNPRAWEGNNQLVGDKIELNMRKDTTIVHGSPRQRVSVTLFPSSEALPRKKSK